MTTLAGDATMWLVETAPEQVYKELPAALAP
jgi:hypothetical protein